MKKTFTAILGIALVAAPAAADVRPADCAPVFPLMDKVAAAPLQDVQVAQAGPTPAAAKKGFFGLPLLLPLLLAGGAAAALGGSGSSTPVSPA